MNIFTRLIVVLATLELGVILDVTLAYTYPLGVQIYTGCSPYEDFVGDYYDCKRFYRCANGWKSSLYCPDGTVYDQSIRTCVNSPNGACIKYASSPYGYNNGGNSNNDYISYNGFTNYNYKPMDNYQVKSQSQPPVASPSYPSSSSSFPLTFPSSSSLSPSSAALLLKSLNTCPYKLTSLEKLVFCSLATFREINSKCC